MSPQTQLLSQEERQSAESENLAACVSGYRNVCLPDFPLELFSPFDRRRYVFYIGLELLHQGKHICCVRRQER